MTKEELAKLLNGRTYGNEIEEAEEQLAKNNGLVVVFGASDDLTEFRGAIYDEIGMYDGGNFFIAKPEDEIPVDEDEETYRKAKKYEPIPLEDESTVSKNLFKVLWSPEEIDCSWWIKTNVPHVTFKIMEDEELYCIGLVFSIYDLK